MYKAQSEDQLFFFLLNIHPMQVTRDIQCTDLLNLVDVRKGIMYMGIGTKVTVDPRLHEFKIEVFEKASSRESVP